MQPDDQKAQSQGMVAGRYRIQAQLGEGGMARVFRVMDERTGQLLALKQLVAEGEDAGTVQAMFEREYHALVQLAHPRIIRVFDYGLDASGPYYTMELLEGAHSRAALKHDPSVREICLLLRDAASALALIHSRRMVHRDVSPRNLWCMPDGRAKLIDFGTLVAMGPQTRIAGTAPFVPPEAVYIQPLDGRCDIYALGALAYYLLTKRNAYPARDIADLRRLWQRPPTRPDAIRPELPQALSDLVMALLSLDLRGRPASAGEVFERLSAIAELPVEDERHLAQAFLTSPTLVGREEASAFLRKRLARALRGVGNSVAVVASSGLGRSRMLGSFVLEAKLMGAAAIAVDATAVGSGPLAVAGALVERLLEALPLTIPMLGQLAPVLSHFSSAIHRMLGKPELAELAPMDRIRKLSSAAVSLVAIASRSQRLMIAVDDVHRADSASLGMLGRLSLLGDGHKLLLVTSCDADTLARPPPALEQLVQAQNRIELAPLSAQHTHELLGSLFGSVAGLDEAASWLHELSQGSPQTCMQYAQYLVDQGAARYEGGRWKLPRHLREEGLPATLGAMFEERVAALGEDARALALGLTLARDESRSAWQPENHVRIEDFPKLLPSGDSARTFLALDELLRAGMVQQRDSYYVLGQRAMVDALLRLTDEETTKAAHRRLAAVFEQAAYQGQMLAVRQLQRAGEHERARDLLRAFGVRVGTGSMDWGAMRVSVSAECTLNALAHWQREGGSPRDGIWMRGMLLMVSAVYDWSMARFGDAQLAQLRADCGLLYWEQTDAALPELQRAIECLTRAQRDYDQKPDAERGLPPADAVRQLAACTLPLMGALVNAHDVARACALASVLDPLRALSPLITLFADACQQAVKRVCGRDFGDELLAGSERLVAAEGIPEVLRIGGAAVNVHTQAVEDARRGRKRALSLIDLLVPGASEDMFLVVHGRWLSHAFHGDASMAERFRKQAEVITEDDVWRRKAFLFVEAQLHALRGDLLGLKHVCEAISELADTFPGWLPWLAYARGELHRLRGELGSARVELERALAQAKPGEHRAWVLAAPAHAELLLLQGDADGALREAEAMLEAVRALALDPMAAVASERLLGLAQSARGEHDAARASLERALVRAVELEYDGLPLAVLHEARARIALAAETAPECAAALVALRALLERADAPALVNAYETLRQQSSKNLPMPELPEAMVVTRTSGADSTATFTDVRTRMNPLHLRQERAEQALALLLEDSGAVAGHLFLFDAGGLFAAASLGGDADERLLAQAQKQLDAEVAGRDAEALTVAYPTMTSSMAPPAAGPTESGHVPVLLSDGREGGAMLIGVALLVSQAKLRTPRPELIWAVSRCLQEAGDSLPFGTDH